jgi:adenine/guanine phosphoribosyltransferase-like PRPP-binding protein
MEAAIELVKKLGVKKIYVNCIIELEGLNGMKYLEGKAEDIECLLKIEVDE